MDLSKINNQSPYLLLFSWLTSDQYWQTVDIQYVVWQEPSISINVNWQISYAAFQSGLTLVVADLAQPDDGGAGQAEFDERPLEQIELLDAVCSSLFTYL